MPEKTYLSPLSPAFWIASVKEFKHLRTLVIAALLSAISIAMGGLFIPVSESLRVYFSFIPRRARLPATLPIIIVQTFAMVPIMNA